MILLAMDYTITIMHHLTCRFTNLLSHQLEFSQLRLSDVPQSNLFDNNVSQWNLTSEASLL